MADTYTEVGVAGTGYLIAASSTTFTLTPTAVGDLIVLVFGGYEASGSPTLSSVSGGPVARWNLVGGVASGTGSVGMAWGVANSTTGGTVTVTMSGATTGACQTLQFHSTGTASGRQWSLDTAWATTSISGATSGNAPSVAPQQTAGELCVVIVGMDNVSTTPSVTAGGFSNVALGTGTAYGIAAFNVAYTGGTISWTNSSAITGYSATACFFTAANAPSPTVVGQAVKRASFR